MGAEGPRTCNREEPAFVLGSEFRVSVSYATDNEPAAKSGVKKMPVVERGLVLAII